jgi:hypothetical protein
MILWNATRAQRLALNMLWCSLLLWPFGALPRETLSGFFGRNAHRNVFCARIAAAIDRMHPGEPRHCFVTATMERHARIALGYHP